MTVENIFSSASLLQCTLHQKKTASTVCFNRVMELLCVLPETHMTIKVLHVLISACQREKTDTATFFSDKIPAHRRDRHPQNKMPAA